MKKFFTVMAAVWAFGLVTFTGIQQASASHIMGSDISFRCLGGNQYEIVVTVYRDCSGIDAPTSIPIDISSTCGTQTVTANAQASNSGIEVSQLCPTAVSTCQGGTLPGVEVYTYTATVTLQPNCGLYTFSYDDCCRNPSNNIVSPTSQGFMVRATLNSNAVVCNTAPNFTSLPVPYFCLGQPVNYSHGAVDADGDSLVYSLIPALDDLGGNIPFTGAYTATSPMPTASGFNFDPQTGQMTFTPTQQGVYVVDVLISEYRNGVLIGTTMRDIQIVIINCSNIAPVVGNCLTPTNVTGGVVVDCNSLGVCPGQTVTFTLGAKDPNGQPITVTSNIAQSIPGASLTSTQVGSPDSVQVVFSWTPTGLDTGFRYFTVQFEDNACPITGLQLFTYDITVLPGTTVGPDRAYCTGSGPILVTATGGSHFSWTPTTGIVSANPDSNLVYFAPSTTTTYYVQSDLQGGCKNRDTITISNVNTFSTSTSTPDDTICLNASTPLTVTPTPLSEGPFTYNWGPSNTGVQDPNLQTTTVRPTTTTTYQVTVVSANGCIVKDSIQVVIQGVAPKIVVNPSANYVCPGTPVTLNSLVRALDCGPTADPLNPCLPGSSFALQDIGTGTASASNNTTPYIGFWMDGRVQYLYRASELQALGLAAGTITDIGFNVITKSSTAPYENFTIKMGCTSLSQLPSSYVSGLPTVANPVSYTTSTGWNTHTLDIPFNWDGFSNVIIEICFDNSAYTQYDDVAYTPTPFTNSVLWDNADLSTGSGCTGLTSPVTGQNRPNTRFIMCVAPLGNYNFTWTGSDGSTLPNQPNPVATINGNVSYTVVIDDGTCQGDTTVDIYIDSNVLITAGPDVAVCNGNAAQIDGEWLYPSVPVCTTQYNVATIPYSLITPTGTVTTANFSGLDDGITPAISMPFPFEFFCQPVNNFTLCTNGYLQFTGNSTTFTPDVIPATAAPNDMIALFWRDLNLNNGGTVNYFVNGTAPNRVLVIRYLNVPFFGGGGTVSGEMQIYENGVIELHQTSFTTGTYTMGIENSNGTIGYAIPGANNQAVTFAGARAYRFTPVFVGNAIQSLQWTPSTNLTSDTIFDPIATPNTTTQYVLTATFTSGCVTRDTVTVGIGNFVFNTTAAQDSICPGDSTQLFFNGAGVTYSWTPTGSLSSATLQNPYASPTVTTEYFVTAYDSIGCRGDDSITITVRTHAPVTLGNDSTICPYNAVTLAPSGSPYVSYAWSTGATTPTITTASQTATSQQYWVRVNDGYCFYNSDTVTITEFTLNPIVVQPSGDTSFCIGDSMTLFADQGYTNYVWSNGATTPVITVSQAGSFWYTATDANGCVLVSQDTANVTPVSPPSSAITLSDNNICLGQQTSVLTVAVANGVVYTWYPGGIVADSLVVTVAGDYYVNANDNGCASNDTVTVTASTPPTENLGPDVSICACDTAITLSATVSGTYNWTGGDSTQTINATTTGIYTVTVTDANGCTATDSVSISLYCLTVNAEVADPATGTVYLGGNGGLNATAGGYQGGVYSYLWTPATFLDDSTKKSPSFQNAQASTTYVVMVTDQTYGCVAYDSVTLAVIPPGIVPMPNAFTPNGDGSNDVFGPYIPQGLAQYWTVVEMRIYNRWGVLMYNGNGNWDGTYNGVLQPADTYIYYIVLNGPDQNNPQQNLNYNLTGSFTLLH
jgi:gliding motility-associated-like protein